MPIRENKADNDDGSLGHKCYVVQVGRENREHLKNETIEIFSMKKFVKNARDCIGNNYFKELLQTDKKEFIDDAAEAFIDQTNHLIKLSTVKARKKQNHHMKIIECLESRAGDLMSKQDAQKKLYRFIDDFKSEIREAGQERPSLADLVKKASQKLENLNRPDLEKCWTCMQEIHGSGIRTRVQFPDLKTFRRIVLSTSNSPARDLHDHSLKIVKTLLRSSNAALKFFHELCAACARTGYIPASLKSDTITFLYKNKGSRGDAGNYRPITIAPSIGKCMDTVILHFLNKLDDRNTDNHAYIANRSCQTAILGLIEYIKLFRAKAKEYRRLGKLQGGRIKSSR